MSSEESSYDGIDSDDDVPQGSESPDMDTKTVIQIRRKFHENLKLLLKNMDKETSKNNTRIKDILKEIKSDGPQPVDRGQLISFVDELEEINSKNKYYKEYMYRELFEVTSRIPKIYDFIRNYWDDEEGGNLKKKSKKKKAKKSRKSRKLKKKAKKSRKQRRKKKRKSKST